MSDVESWGVNGKDPNSILNTPLKDHSSWHIFQARSWLDYAKRSQIPSAIQYAALEMRYGLEYMLFELLVLVSDNLTEAEYARCLGDPSEMKKMLGEYGANYEKLAEFTRVLLSLTPNSPEIRTVDFRELFKFWGIASEFVHFFGTHTRTFRSDRWIIESIARLDSILGKLWSDIELTLGLGVMRPSKMEPEVRQAWEEYLSGSLSADKLRIRLRLIQPILVARRRRL